MRGREVPFVGGFVGVLEQFSVVWLDEALVVETALVRVRAHLVGTRESHVLVVFRVRACVGALVVRVLRLFFYQTALGTGVWFG